MSKSQMKRYKPMTKANPWPFPTSEKETTVEKYTKKPVVLRLTEDQAEVLFSILAHVVLDKDNEFAENVFEIITQHEELFSKYQNPDLEIEATLSNDRGLEIKFAR